MILFPAISNLALHKPTQQISTQSEGPSERAVDGNKDGNYEASPCTHTKTGSGNWWMVDLESTNVIYEVRIHNRLHFGKRISYTAKPL